jgi:phosphoglycerate dehydrogenase-like enzyme
MTWALILASVRQVALENANLRAGGWQRTQAMKLSARLININTSRGPIIDEPALIEVLRESRIAAAALDVFDIEPSPADHPFRSLSNVVATPHIGYVARDVYRTFYGDTVENITRHDRTESRRRAVC